MRDVIGVGLGSSHVTRVAQCSGSEPADVGAPLVDHRTSGRSLRFNPLSRTLDGVTLRVDDESRPAAKASAHEQDRVLRLDILVHEETLWGGEYFSMGPAAGWSGLEPSLRGAARRSSWNEIATVCV